MKGEVCLSLVLSPCQEAAEERGPAGCQIEKLKGRGGDGGELGRGEGMCVGAVGAGCQR